MKRKIHLEIDSEIINFLDEVRNYADNKKMKLLLKLGKDGSIYVDETNKLIRMNAFNFIDLPIVDTTGAGDCFTASFASQLLENKSPEECLLYATCAAYFSITKFGAMPSLPNKSDVEAILDRVKNIKK